MKEKKEKDQRWWQIKQRAQIDPELNSAARNVFLNLVDHLAKSRQRIGDPFVLSWRVVRMVSERKQGYEERQCYRIIRQLEKAEYIFPTPRRYVRDFILAKQSQNPAAVKYYNFKFEKLKGATARQWREVKEAIDNPTDMADEYGLK